MKKRLGLLPEVLPDPRASRPTGQGPRDRTLQQLQRLVAVAAASAIGGCGPGGPFGYGVVDPMPAPPLCPGADADVVVEATWEGENIVLKMTIRPNATTRFEPLEPRIDQGALVVHSIGPDAALVVITPNLGTPMTGVHLQVKCPAGPSYVTLTLTRAAPGSPISIDKTSSTY